MSLPSFAQLLAPGPFPGPSLSSRHACCPTASSVERLASRGNGAASRRAACGTHPQPSRGSCGDTAPGPRAQVEPRLRGRGRRAREQVPGWPGREWVCGGPWCPPAPAQPTLSKKGRMRTATCSSTERRSQGSSRPSSFARPSMASRATRLCGSSPSSSPLIMEVRSWGPWARTWGCITLSCVPGSPNPGAFHIASQACQAVSAHLPGSCWPQLYCPSQGRRGVGQQLTLSGEPEAMLARPRSTSRRTLAHASFCRAARLSSSDSRSIKSLTTLLLSSWRQRNSDPPGAGPSLASPGRSLGSAPCSVPTTALLGSSSPKPP